MSLIVFSSFFIGLKILSVLIDSIVGQMHTEILKIIIFGLLIFLSGKSGQTFFKEVDT